MNLIEENDEDEDIDGHGFQIDDDNDLDEEKVKEEYGDKMKDLKEESELIYILLKSMSFENPLFKQRFHEVKQELIQVYKDNEADEKLDVF